MDCLIWSKNRACQLDLLLRSIQINFPILKNIHILYISSNSLFRNGYKKLINKFPYVVFHKEKSFKQDNINIFNNFSSNYSLNFVDDDVLINPISKKDINGLLTRFKSNPKIHTVSLRLDMSMVYNHPQDRFYPLPKFIETESFLLWNWLKMESYNEWGYPCSISSYVYRMNQMKWYINNLNYDFPGGLEGQMSSHRVDTEPLMISFTKTRVFCIPNNMVQKSHNRHSENSEFTVEVLNKKYLEGFIIDTKNIFGYKGNSPHQEIPFQFIKE